MNSAHTQNEGLTVENENLRMRNDAISKESQTRVCRIVLSVYIHSTVRTVRTVLVCVGAEWTDRGVVCIACGVGRRVLA